jgi:hypothetical protein
LGNFFWETPRGTVNAETASIGYGGHGLDIMCEAEDRAVDSKSITHWTPYCAHAYPQFLVFVSAHYYWAHTH